MEEIWKDIPNYEGIYQVSDLGRVKSLSRNIWNGVKYAKYKEIILSPRKTKGGYIKYCLRKNKTPKEFKAHQLVAMAFLNHKPCGHKLVVDHVDNNPSNNRLNNLQLTTNRYNCIKDKKQGSSKYTGVHFCNTAKMFISKIYINGKSVFLGKFINEEKAYLAYQRALNNLYK